eukprot:SAG31_NODE_325_length_17671_cov_9.902743_15_plen_602_part_00
MEPALSSPAPAPHPSAAAGGFVFLGVKPRALLRLLQTHPEIQARGLSTSDVCHTILKPMTTPDGWVNVPTLINPAQSWYRHQYHPQGRPTQLQSEPPAGTRSYADILLADPDLAELVGFPTVFWSHPWKDLFAQVVATMAEQYPEEFVWFDCAVLDEHASQSFTQDWWSTTFKDAIKTIGHTVMRLSPWHDPHTLRRAWCLWEVYCSVVGGAKFSVSLDTEQRQQFVSAILEDYKVVQEKFAKIDVKTAEAGNPDDESMIKAAVQAMPGGFATCNEKVFDQIRIWIDGIKYDLAWQTLGMDLRSEDWARTKRDDELTEEDLRNARSTATLLDQQGQTEEARAMYVEVIDGFTAKLGAHHVDTVKAKTNLANLLKEQGQTEEARAMYVEVIDGFTAKLGADHAHTVTAKMNLANLLKEQGQTEEARAMYVEVIDGYTAKLGADHVDTVMTKMNLANLLAEQGQTEEARAMYVEVIDVRTAKLGADHVDTVNAKMNLAVLLDEQDETEEARAMFVEVIDGFTAKLGADHVGTVRAKMNLGVLYETALHDYEKAKEIYEECVYKFTAKLGENHSLTQQAKDNLQDALDAISATCTVLSSDAKTL